MDGENQQGDWAEWRVHVLAEIRRFNDGLERCTAQQAVAQTEMSGLKVQAAIYGSIGGMLVSLILAKFILGL